MRRSPARLALCLCALLALGHGGALGMGQKPQEAPGAPEAAAPAETPAPETPPAAAPAAPAKPSRAEALKQTHIQVLRDYYTFLATCDPAFPGLFSRRVKKDEEMAFAFFVETQRRRGVLKRFQNARVNLDGLVFTHLTNDPDLVRIRVTGSYTLDIPPAFETIDENTLFVLLPENDAWKIFERRDP